MINFSELEMVSGSWVLLHSRLALHDFGVMTIRDALARKIGSADG